MKKWFVSMILALPPIVGLNALTGEELWRDVAYVTSDAIYVYADRIWVRDGAESDWVAIRVWDPDLIECYVPARIYRIIRVRRVILDDCMRYWVYLDCLPCDLLIIPRRARVFLVDPIDGPTWVDCRIICDP